MAACEEERLAQSVRDFIESETPSAPPPIPTAPLRRRTLLHLLEGILDDSTDAEEEVFDKAIKHVSARAGEHEGSRDKLKKSLMMRLRLDGYGASLCRSSWVSTMDCPGGEYEYIDIVMADENGAPTRILVDIEFRSQFELARPTVAYAQLTSILPSVFVGREEKLKKVVSLLCSAAQESLRERGLHAPPWRRSIYMHSKWFSCCHKASAIPYLAAASIHELKLKGASHEGSSIRSSKGGSALSSQFSDNTINCC